MRFGKTQKHFGAAARVKAEKKPRRLGIRAAREMARLAQEQEQWEILAGEQLPEEWAPFGGTFDEQHGGEGGDEEQAEQDDAAAAEEQGADEQDEGEEEGAEGQSAEDEEQDTDFREDGSIKVTPDAPLPLFSHFSEKEADGTPVYRRSFGSVRDFCLQPFANQRNEALWRREEYSEGTFRKWKVGIKLRAHHDSLKDEDDVRQKNLDWFGAENGDESAARAFKGWPEGAEKVRSMMEDVNAPAPLDLRRRIHRGDQGDEVDVHQVYRGALDRAWTSRRRRSSRSRMSVRLVALLGGSNLVKHEEMFWRGAAVAKLAEVLEEAGYRVEIVCAQQSRLDAAWEFRSEKDICAEYQNFVLKDAAAPLDLEQVAGVLCNAGFFRTWGFRASYAIAEQRLRDTIRVPETEYKQVGRKVQKVPTGRTSIYTLQSRSHVVGADPVAKQDLATDGTLTFSVPADIGERGSAVKWVNECLVKLESGEEVAHEEE